MISVTTMTVAAQVNKFQVDLDKVSMLYLLCGEVHTGCELSHSDKLQPNESKICLHSIELFENYLKMITGGHFL